jgi:hypothetical protein
MLLFTPAPDQQHDVFLGDGRELGAYLTFRLSGFKVAAESTVVCKHYET